MAWTSSIATRATTYDVLASDWNVLVNNLNFLDEVGYAEITANVSSSATTVGTAVQVVSLGALTYQNAPHIIEFSCPRLNASASNTTLVILRDGTTVIGTLADPAATTVQSPCYISRRITPSAASHTYNIALWNVAGTSTVLANSGGAAGDATTLFPAWMRASRIPT
jgi:hypothetical protein